MLIRGICALNNPASQQLLIDTNGFTQKFPATLWRLMIHLKNAIGCDHRVLRALYQVQKH